jgi:alpha-ketoglutarate-dependent taurine dioxygenase
LADKEKNALFGAATKVVNLTQHIGTEIVGLQLKDLTDQQKDELALLIAERSVVFFRDQDLSPQQQRALGEYFGEVEVHVRIFWFPPSSLSADSFIAFSSSSSWSPRSICHLA